MQSAKHNGGIQEQLGEKILALSSMNGQLIEIPVPYMYIYLSVTLRFYFCQSNKKDLHGMSQSIATKR